MPCSSNAVLWKVFLVFFVITLCIGCTFLIGLIDQPPVPDITFSPQSPIVGELVTLNGTKSRDPQNYNLSFDWSLTGPSGSKTQLLNATDQKIVMFAPDLAGSWIIVLTITEQGGTGKTAFLSKVLNVVSSSNATMTLSTSVSPTGSGTVTLNPPGGIYSLGVQVTITAVPNSGYTFNSWSGDASGTTNPLTITATKNMMIGAIFEPIQTKITVTTGSVQFSMHYMQGGTFYVGPNPPGVENVTLSHDYWVAETEVTYQLWQEVKTWANTNGYTFTYDGRGGGQLPVSTVSWRDCVIWCNALSQKTGLSPVYYTDSAFTFPLKTSSADFNIDMTPGTCDNPYVNWNAMGYRLPTQVEFEVAARGGIAAKVQNSYQYTYSGSDNVDATAWYSFNSGGTKHIVGTKAPNALGLFDMSGNVVEYCWDWYGSYPTSSVDPTGESTGTTRTEMSGSWAGDKDYCVVYNRFSRYPAAPNTSDVNGFRFLRIVQ